MSEPDLSPHPAPDLAGLPTVRALEDLWLEVQRKPLYAPGRILKFLRLRRQTKLRLVPSSTLSVVAPPGKVNDCRHCTEICCLGAHATVSLRLRDIATLIDIERTDLISRQKPAFDPEDLKARPALRRHVASHSWKRFPVLKKNSFGACAALTTEGHCGLFPYWPLSCARFPYSIRPEEKEIFYSPRCDAFWIHPRAGERVEQMVVATAASYNERIKDLVLLEYAAPKLRDLGLTQYLDESENAPQLGS